MRWCWARDVAVKTVIYRKTYDPQGLEYYLARRVGDELVAVRWRITFLEVLYRKVERVARAKRLRHLRRELREAVNRYLTVC